MVFVDVVNSRLSFLDARATKAARPPSFPFNGLNKFPSLNHRNPI
jgi:hypothetical protein